MSVPSTAKLPASTNLPVVFLLGPTASGKTAIGLELNQLIDCDLISVDSTAVYRRMDIGSAKPTSSEQAVAPHQLIDIREPWETYSAADFRSDALAAIQSSIQRNRLPVLLGGTMLYFKALEHGLSQLPAADPNVRAELEVRAQSVGWAALHDELARIDSVAAARIHPNDPQRIQRALEVWQVSGTTLTDWQQQPSAEPMPWPVCKFALIPSDRAALHARIEQRFRTILQMGLLDEVRSLAEEPLINRELASMRAVGYRQAWNFLADECDESELLQSGQAATRQLAKRQLTWMRSMQNLIELDSQGQGPAELAALIERTLLDHQQKPGSV